MANLAEMEPVAGGRFTLGKQSSLMPRREESAEDLQAVEMAAGDEEPEIMKDISLMYAANEGDVEGIRELLEAGANANFMDIDGRTALHVAACQGFTEVVEMLLRNGAKVDPKDRWGSTVGYAVYS